jgi:hypothetical protein
MAEAAKNTQAFFVLNISAGFSLTRFFMASMFVYGVSAIILRPARK